MIDYEQAVEVANHYRVSEGREHMADGFVRVYAGRVYGWSAELGEASCERPGALAIDAAGNVSEAVGGDADAGALAWEEIERPCRYVDVTGAVIGSLGAGPTTLGEIREAAHEALHGTPPKGPGL